MGSHLLQTIISIFFFIFISVYPIAHSADDEQYVACNATYNCGNLRNIQYPFWSNDRPKYCGREEFELICEENQNPTIVIGVERFHVLNISQSRPEMTVVPIDIWEDRCPDKFTNISLNESIFAFAPSVRNLSIFYGCPSQVDIPVRNKFNCSINGRLADAYFADESLSRINAQNLSECDITVTIPVNLKEFEELSAGKNTLDDVLNEPEFELVYSSVFVDCLACQSSGGKCGSNVSSSEFLCLCPDEPYPRLCVLSGTHSAL